MILSLVIAFILSSTVAAAAAAENSQSPQSEFVSKFFHNFKLLFLLILLFYQIDYDEYHLYDTIDNGHIYRINLTNDSYLYKVNCAEDNGYIVNSNDSGVYYDDTNGIKNRWLPVNGFLIFNLPLCSSKYISNFNIIVYHRRVVLAQAQIVYIISNCIV